MTTSNCRRVNQVCLTQYPRVACLSTEHASDALKRAPSADFVYALEVAKFTEITEFHALTPNTYGPQLSLDATIQSPVKNVASILRPLGKTFFSTERRESNSFHYRNHATHRIRD